MKKIAIALMLVIGMSVPAYANEYGTDERDVVAGTVIAAAWAFGASASINSLVSQTTPASYVLFGMIAGPIREIQTNPAKRGLYAYNGQAASIGKEDRKWEKIPGSKRWKGLKGYATNENEVARLQQVAQADLDALDAKKYR